MTRLILLTLVGFVAACSQAETHAQHPHIDPPGVTPPVVEDKYS